MKRLIIGDIHGCFAEMQELLDKAGLGQDDELIALGDMVDRGPDSPRVLQFFQVHSQARSLMGNHERKHIRSFRGEIPPALSQVITRQQFAAAYPEAITFMQTLPRFLELPEAILVHGFFEPDVSLEQQRDSVLIGTLSGEKYLTETYPHPWYELYRGQKPLVVGHRDFLGTGQPFIYQDHVFGLDTGCYHGGTLTGLVLPNFQFVSVPSRNDYWTELKREYRAVSHPTSSANSHSQDQPDPMEWNRLADLIQRAHAQIWAQLNTDPSFRELSAHAQARIYAAQIRHLPRPLQYWLHLARRGEFTFNVLRSARMDSNQLRDWVELLGKPDGVMG